MIAAGHLSKQRRKILAMLLRADRFDGLLAR
jgi:hypothetical protein